MLFHSTRFRNKFDNKPMPESASWEHFCHKFKERVIREDKDGPLFSPAKYADSLDGYRVEGTIKHPKEAGKNIGQVWINNYNEKIVTDMQNNIVRKNENVRLVSMAVFDFDSGEQPEVIREKFKGLNHIIYSTHSSTKASPKFRLILPFKDELTAAQFKDAWPFAVEKMDPSCKDPSRMYYTPSVPKAHADAAFTWIEQEKKLFAPKIPEKKKEKAKKKKRGDYNTLDAVTWFSIHGALLGPAGQEHKYFVVCPWAVNHTEGKQGETDSVLWTEPKKWPTFNCSHAHCTKKNIKDVMKLWGDADEFCSEEMTADKLKTDTEIRCLGFDDAGRYYYQCNKTNHIVPLKAGEHKELNFYSITADMMYWTKHFGDEDSGHIKWKVAAAKMMSDCHKRGFFRPDAVRGGGVWEDAGRIVAHLGRNLLVDGIPTPLTEFKSSFIYEAMVHDVNLPAPLSDADMRKVYDMAFRFPLANPNDAVYLAGASVCGLLSGILSWRPHIWLTGDQASGKSSILTYFLNPVWAPAGGVMAEGRTSDAGIRQKLRRNAYPFIVDESEADTRADSERMEGIVSLARSSSSVSEGRVLKGTISGQGQEFLVRSVFALCSITHALEKPQDRQRFTILPCRMTDEKVASWPEFKKELKGTITPAFALGLYSRLLELADTIMDNAMVFQKAIIDKLKCDARVGEHLGHLMAGACILTSPMLISPEQATKFISQMGVLPVVDKSESNVPQTALNMLYSFILQDGMKRMSVGEHTELIGNVMPGFESSDESAKMLKRYGMMVREGFLLVSSNHPSLVKMFKEAGITGHYGLLSLIEGAEAGSMARFGMHQSRAVKIPLVKETK